MESGSTETKTGLTGELSLRSRGSHRRETGDVRRTLQSYRRKGLRGVYRRGPLGATVRGRSYTFRGTTEEGVPDGPRAPEPDRSD